MDATAVSVQAKRVPEPVRRLRQKLNVLESWVQNGVPPDKEGSRPRTLTEAREWNDRSLGVSGKGSASYFVTTHPQYGSTVSAIARAIEKLNARPGSSSQTRIVVATAKEPDLRGQEGLLKEAFLDDALKAAVAQWHMERHVVDSLRAMVEDKAFKLAIAEEDAAKLADEVAELKRRLMANGSKPYVISDIKK